MIEDTGGDKIGSPTKMFDLLQAAQSRNSDAPTKDHSYVTLQSLAALKFGILSFLECELNVLHSDRNSSIHLT